MRLFIDGKQMELERDTMISISISVARLTQIESSRMGYSKTILIPMTDHNRWVMGDSEQINSSQMFNQKTHTARIEAEGCTVLEGVPYLMESVSSSQNGEGGYYRVNIVGSAKSWSEMAEQTPLRELKIEYLEKITPAMILKSWSEQSPVRFLPVQRDGFQVVNITQNVFPPIKVLTFENYHPFIHIKQVVERIFEQAGYGIDSKFMQSDYFNSLYMSGNYPRKDTSVQRATMEFKAGRFKDAVAVADSWGRVYADPSRGYSTIGNLVDSADPDEQVDGVSIEGVYTKGGMLQRDEKRVVFRPSNEVVMGVEYALLYRTDYYMKSRDELSGFNRINLEDGAIREYKIANKNIDRRTELRTNKNFTAIIFDYVQYFSYLLTYNEVTNPNADLNNLHPTDYITQSLTILNTRSSNVVIKDNGNRVTSPQIWYKVPEFEDYLLYHGDWALYDGYVKERGEIEVEVTLRSAAERVLPSKPKYFDMVYFGGAEPGMKLTLRKESRIRSIFVEYPSEGSTVNFSQVAAHRVSCLGLINALKQLFNLYFYTNQATKTVHIEPRSSFYLKDSIIDWSHKIDLNKPISNSELGADMAQTMVLEYQSGDGAVMRWNQSNQQTLGRWWSRIGNIFAKQGERSYKNPIFTASLSKSGIYPDALSAELIQAGDREQSAVEGNEELNFAPKIVHYLGMRPLTKGERWGWPSNGASYPMLTFHRRAKGATGALSPLDFDKITTDKMFNDGVSLCFEDRDDNVGLHTLYDHNMELYNRGRRVELYLTLSPEDIEPMVNPNRLKQDFRALYRLTIDGENALYRLEEIVDYNPCSKESTKCVFIKEI